MNHIARAIKLFGHAAAQPPPSVFPSAEAAWLALSADRDDPRFLAINTTMDTLYRQRRIDLVHARILRIWGDRQMAPNAAYAGERGDARLWREALSRLEWPLRVKGIVA